MTSINMVLSIFRDWAALLGGFEQQKIMVAEAIIHSKFEDWHDRALYDIAILRLEKEMRFDGTNKTGSN